MVRLLFFVFLSSIALASEASESWECQNKEWCEALCKVLETSPLSSSFKSHVGYEEQTWLRCHDWRRSWEQVRVFEELGTANPAYNWRLKSSQTKCWLKKDGATAKEKEVCRPKA